jgi:predicted nuclease of predicted toxin-antitoxin system
LLFDQNLSYRLVRLLAKDFPGSQHVNWLRLRDRTDRSIWQHAVTQDLVIVSKDADFLDLAAVKAPPPKVIYLVVGNAGTAPIARALRARAAELRQFAEDPSAVYVLTLADEEG